MRIGRKIFAERNIANNLSDWSEFDGCAAIVDGGFVVSHSEVNKAPACKSREWLIRPPQCFIAIAKRTVERTAPDRSGPAPFGKSQAAFLRLCSFDII